MTLESRHEKQFEKLVDIFYMAGDNCTLRGFVLSKLKMYNFEKVSMYT